VVQTEVQFELDKVRLVRVFKQQFSVFLEIRVSKKMCENMCNII